MAKRLKILFIASEAAPFIKVGGLGDVAGALPPALRALPEKPDLRLVIPLHPQIDQTAYTLTPVASFDVKHKKGPIKAEVYQTKLKGLPVYLIGGEPLHGEGSVYSTNTKKDGLKFTFFSLAALELAKVLDWKPDVLHAQDWHTAPAIYALKTIYQDDSFFAGIPTLLTVHNLPYLGNGTGPALKAFGLKPAKNSKLPEWAQGFPLPLALLTTDKINTVSEGYAGEMLTKPFGSGLHTFLKSRKDDLIGIVNGLDLDAWDPQTDKAIAQNFSIDALKERQANKLALQSEVGLPEAPDVPLLAFIGRMDYQKGIEIALGALRKIKSLDWQAVILGTGDPEIEEKARQLAEKFPDKVKAVIAFDGGLARRIYAGADIMMIPSRYEPCGLIQMIAMRYGCVPVARATGGLRDTIKDVDEGTGSTGFLFEKATQKDMAAALQRALAVYPDKRRWPNLQKRGMRQDFSWEKSAQQYLDVYQELASQE
ncbi:MAG TPA: glycogen/starch synthase [Anaerolineales bacterium]|nr:glycogen/starch synthase [Anaerolineales bacterium]